MHKLWIGLIDRIGEWAYRREYKRRYAAPDAAQRARTLKLLEDRAAIRRHFDVDEDYCRCPKTCPIH